MIQQGVVEKVVVPSKKKRSKVATVLCLRLVDETSTVSGDGVVVVPPIVGNEEDNLGKSRSFHLLDVTNFSLGSGGFKLNVTVHKQISDLLEEAGTAGMTLTVVLTLCLNNTSHSPCYTGTIGFIVAIRQKNHRTHPYSRRKIPASFPSKRHRSRCSSREQWSRKASSILYRLGLSCTRRKRTPRQVYCWLC